jgi:hypothetical protein
MSLKDVVPFYQRVILQIGHFGTAKPSFISSSFMVQLPDCENSMMKSIICHILILGLV